MKKLLTAIILLSAFWVTAIAQNIGIGTLSPTGNLEIKSPGLSAIKISAASNMDTTRLTFSNRDEFIGTDMSLTFLHEQGLFFSSKSMFPYMNSDSILFMTPRGFVGINTISPVERLDVNGRVRSNGLMIRDNNLLELGVGLEKQEDNGKIGLNVFGDDNTLSIVGGGTALDGSDRKIKFWADSAAVFTGRGSFLKNVGIGVEPTANMLTIAAGHGSLLSLRNTNSLNTGVIAAMAFGGNNYTTGIIRTVGNSSSNARMAFVTGYSFTGGASNLQERLTIANNGNVGVNNTNPQATLDIGGTMRFTGVNSPAFRITLRGNMMYNGTGPAAVIDSVNGTVVRIDHPLCNNDPNAIIIVRPLGLTATTMASRYDASNGFWYITPDMPYKYNTRPANYRMCIDNVPFCINNIHQNFLFVISSEVLNKDEDQWNLLVLKN
jgi:hypothetical protein